MFGGEEYRVKKVDLGEWEDLRVKYVLEEVADRPGHWTVVESNEDFKIKICGKRRRFYYSRRECP